MADNKVDIEIKANVTGTPAVDALGQSLNSTGGAADKLGAGANNAAGGVDKADSAAKGFTTTSGKLREGLESVSAQMAAAKTELLALVGIGAGTQGLKNIADLADNYNNLQARIKLATGEGRAFDDAFAGVFAVAKRTNSAVEETGLLFTKLAAAGKELGISQAEALKLTETINQAIQLSGASAEASKASIVQLVQGLQSGVLRGDEFNSVMEQSPRLTQALAEGLGVTTGALRKMAEEGKLTSATIISALQGQSDAVANEFGKLPATVGRAMTNLTTEFTRYVGEADKAGGYTTKLAGLIDALAGNLSTVATVMLHTGEVLGAMKLLSMAQDWLSASAAVTAHATATSAATAKTVTDTAAKETNTLATLSNAQAAATNAVAHDSMGLALGKAAPVLTGNAKAMTELGAALGGAATGAGNLGGKAGQAVEPVGSLGQAAGIAGGAFGALARAVAPLLAMDIALHFKQYGTAIGEWAARMAGAKDRTEELARAEKLADAVAQDTIDMRKRQAAALVEATNANFGLTKASKDSIAEFDKLTKAGDSSAEAIKKIGKDFDLSTIPGIKSAAQVLDKLTADGKISAVQFQAAWSDALKGQDLAEFEVKFRVAMLQTQADAQTATDAWADAIKRGVSGKELEKFATDAQQAMAAAGRAGEQLAQVLDASLREAVKRTGKEYDLLAGNIGKTAQSALNDTDTMIKGLDRLKAMGIDTGAALTASLGKGIDTADSQKAIELVRIQIAEVRKTLGDKVADGLLEQAKTKATELSDALDKAKPGVNSLREAMLALGVTSDQTFKDTAAKSAAAYQAMKDSGTASLRELQAGFQKYAADAIAANGGVASEALKAEAAMRGLQLQADGTGQAIVRGMGQAKGSVQELRAEVEGTSKVFQGLEDHFKSFNKYSRDGGTGTNTLPIDKITALAAKVREGKDFAMTQADFDAAKKQSDDIIQWLMEIGPAGALAANEARQTAGALKSTFIHITDKPVAPQQIVNGRNTTNDRPGDNLPQSSSQGSTSHTVNVTINGYNTPINVASESDAQNLIKALQRAQQTAGG